MKIPWKGLICLAFGHQPYTWSWGNEYITLFSGNDKEPSICTKLCGFCLSTYTEVDDRRPVEQ